MQSGLELLWYLPLFRPQTKRLIKWIMRRNEVSEELENSILQNQNRFRSDGVGFLIFLNK